MLNYEQYLYGLVDMVLKQGASDINLGAGRPPILRIDGNIVKTKGNPLKQEDLERIVEIILDEDDQKFLAKNLSVDAAFSYRDTARFRVNVYYKLGNLAIAMRFIPAQTNSIEDLRLPPVISKFAEMRNGLVLVVGPTGHGKTTTAASLLHTINQKRQEHIITIEDPVEYIYSPVQSIIDQREVGRDVLNFSNGLKESLRQDPDVIFVGEVRDLDTIKTTITAAETGHLVLATLNANSTSQSINRIINLFAAEEQGQIRNNLSITLAGIIAIRLVPSLHGGRYPVVEVLFATKSVRNIIRTNKIYEIDMIIETNLDLGMISLDRSLLNLIRAGEISHETGKEYAIDRTGFSNLLENL